MATFSLTLPGFVAILFASFIVWAHVDDAKAMKRRRDEVEKDVRHAHGVLWERGAPIRGSVAAQP